jgi:thioredoxin 1
MARKIIIVALLLVAVIVVVARKQTARAPSSQPVAGLPRLVDLGRGTCIPCKQMMPVLDAIKTEYQGRLIVEVIDLRDDPDAGDKYRVHLIPTQIFYDASGKELFRHEGFMPKEDILAKWKEFGIELGSANTQPAGK